MSDRANVRGPSDGGRPAAPGAHADGAAPGAAGDHPDRGGLAAAGERVQVRGPAGGVARAGGGRRLRVGLGAALAVAAAIGTAALSRVPYAHEDADHALVRLSWRFRGELVEACRAVTPEERDRMPAHMRRDEVCEGRVAPYHLRFALGDVVLADDTVHAGGTRRDRPVYVFREYRVEPGAHRLRVAFGRLDDSGEPRITPNDAGAAAAGAARVQPRDGAVRASLPVQEAEVGAAALVLDGRIEVSAGEVLLITYDPDLGALVARGRGRVVEPR